MSKVPFPALRGSHGGEDHALRGRHLVIWGSPPGCQESQVRTLRQERVDPDCQNKEGTPENPGLPLLSALGTLGMAGWAEALLTLRCLLSGSHGPWSDGLDSGQLRQDPGPWQESRTQQPPLPRGLGGPGWVRSDVDTLTCFHSVSGLCGLVLRLGLPASRGVGPGPASTKVSPLREEQGPPPSGSEDLAASDPLSCLPWGPWAPCAVFSVCTLRGLPLPPCRGLGSWEVKPWV